MLKPQPKTSRLSAFGIELRVPKSYKQKIVKLARKKGYTLSGMIRFALDTVFFKK